MDRKHIEMMLQMAEKERRALDELIVSLKAQLGDEGQSRRKPRKRGEASPIAMRIRNILSHTRRVMSPSQIEIELSRTGDPVKATRIRNILQKYKGDLWESPAHGKWRTLSGDTETNDDGERGDIPPF